MMKWALALAVMLISLVNIALAQEKTDNPNRVLDDQRSTLQEVRGALEQEEPADLQELRDQLSASRSSLDEFIATLELEIEALPAPPPDTAEASKDEAQSDSAETPQSDQATNEIETLDRSEELERREEIEGYIQDAIDLVSKFDRLSSEIASRQRLIELQAGVDERRSAISTIETALTNPDLGADYIALREQLRSLKTASNEAIAPLRESRGEVRADLDRLGPAPEAEVEELPEISAEREALTLALVQEDAIVRQSELNIAEIDRLLNDITTLRRDQFYGAVLSRAGFPFRPSVVQSAYNNFLNGLQSVAKDREVWRTRKSQAGSIWQSYGIIALSLAVGLFLFGPTRRWASSRILSQLETLEPTPGRRAGAVIVRVLARAIPGFIAGAIVFKTLQLQWVINEATEPVARNLWFGFLALLVVDSAASAVFAPGTPGWRLVPLQKISGQVIRISLLILVFIFFADRTLEAGAAIYGGNQELARVQSAVIAILMSIEFFILTSKSFWHMAEGREDAISTEAKSFWRMCRRILRLSAIAILGAIVFGYVALAHYAATRIFMLAGLLALGLFMKLIAHEVLRAFDRSLAGKTDQNNDEETDQEGLVFFWIGVFLDLVIFAALTPVAFLALGADWADVRDVVQDAFFGFKIGNFTISISKILSALAIFVLILGVTRFLQRTGERSFFPRTRMDIGVQNSLKTMMGYVGLLIALVAGISVLGFNLSNLAIIAGALSVGIGFGLQSIVSNFVSGLILLFERPIKVGDWIVTSSGEGIVKSINVRSTEIETFDRSSVIVPNSELVTGTVTNWTYKNKMGRVVIPVGVSYDADPELVIRLLEEVGKESPVLLSYPEPFVYFGGFGDSSLDFDLRGYVRDIGSSLSARTALRVAIFKKLNEAGIEIPFPQRDLHVKSEGMTGRPT
ncbi:MAG: mechanosensitive ion channel domain-containing protein [Pseudomonadota bacterium]